MQVKESIYSPIGTSIMLHEFDSFMFDLGYKWTFADHYVYIKYFHDNHFIILLVYINDMPIVGKDHLWIDRLMKELNKSFGMKDLDLAQHILEIKVYCDKKKGKE